MELPKAVSAVVQETVCPRVVLAAMQDLATPVMTVSMFVLAKQVSQLHCFHSQECRYGSAAQVGFQLVGALPARGSAWVAHWYSEDDLVLLVMTALEEVVVAVVEMPSLELCRSSLSRDLTEEFLVPCRPETI